SSWRRFRRIRFRTIAAPGTRFRGCDDRINNVREPSGFGRVDPGAPAYVLPTGGTTGAPKAVTLSHRNLMAQAWQLSHWSHGVPGEETILAVVPFFHSQCLSACGVDGLAL